MPTSQLALGWLARFYRASPLPVVPYQLSLDGHLSFTTSSCASIGERVRGTKPWALPCTHHQQTAEGHSVRLHSCAAPMFGSLQQARCFSEELRVL